MSFSTEVNAGSRTALLFEGVSENMDARIRALYLRVTPLPGRALDLQAGLVPPVFGAFARQAYSDEGPFIGIPLGYQYLTTVRADAVPAGADDLLAVRGRGWYVQYPSEAFPSGPGVPLASGSRWDAGLQLRAGNGPVEAAVSLTRGTLCDPRVSDTNDGEQLAGRVVWRPDPALTFGVSGARGSYLASEVTDSLPSGLDRAYHQSAAGVDASFARGHLMLRAEAVVSWWQTPPIGPAPVLDPLRALALYVEGRYKVAPGVTVGARFDRLTFNTIRGTDTTDTWDANVTRLEAGAAWTPRRHFWLRAVYQYNWRDTDYYSRAGFLAGQLGVWF